MTFGSFIKERRLNLVIGINTFCELAEVNPVIYGLVEKNLISVKHIEKIPGEFFNNVIYILKIQKHSEDYNKLLLMFTKSINSEFPEIDVDNYVKNRLPPFGVTNAHVQCLTSNANLINELNGYK